MRRRIRAHRESENIEHECDRRDARGRPAMMVFDFFYKRLSARRVITSMIYDLPLMQNQIGAFPGFTVVHVYLVLRSLRDERIVNLESTAWRLGSEMLLRAMLLEASTLTVTVPLLSTRSQPQVKAAAWSNICGWDALIVARARMRSSGPGNSVGSEAVCGQSSALTMRSGVRSTARGADASGLPDR